MARILLAEDDDSMRHFLCQSLERAGHAVDAVGDGRHALEAFEADHYDLLLADIVMPGIDGVELVRRASKGAPDLKVMIITGFAAITMNQHQNLPREARVMSKPFHLRELVSQVNRLLDAGMNGTAPAGD